MPEKIRKKAENSAQLSGFEISVSRLRDAQIKLPDAKNPTRIFEKQSKFRGQCSSAPYVAQACLASFRLSANTNNNKWTARVRFQSITRVTERWLAHVGSCFRKDSTRRIWGHRRRTPVVNVGIVAPDRYSRCRSLKADMHRRLPLGGFGAGRDRGHFQRTMFSPTIADDHRPLELSSATSATTASTSAATAAAASASTATAITASTATAAAVSHGINNGGSHLLLSSLQISVRTASIVG